MPKRKRINKWLFGGGILVAVVVIVVTIVVLNNRPSNDGDDKKTDNTSEVKEKKPEQRKEEKKEEETKPEKEQVVQYSGDNPNESEALTGVISYAGVSGDNLNIRVNIDQYLGGGSCKIVLMKDGGTVYTADAAIESSVSTSICDGFLVPIAKIGTGNFEVEITLMSGDKYGKIKREVNI